ncbi:helix-turn-helix domain-containing protein [Mycobacterium sp. B14F4]|uniref:helix-turn-helix domain-containing protein n=1 Tax=Mycobacterium sp. B14F4 TaxID=3153565 RepID=UPI00325E0EEA
MARLPREVLEQAVEQINRETLSISQLAKLAGKHPDTIIRYIAKGRLHAFKVGHAVLIWRDDAKAAL